MRPSRPRRLFMAATPALCFALASCSSPQSAPQGQNGDDEIQMGQEVFNELKAKGEIVKSSVLYDRLAPMADAVTRAAQPRYGHPFKFYLVHEQQPNAFATPGGNVYVTDALLYFVRNTEQLAGTLCHEVSHRSITTRSHSSRSRKPSPGGRWEPRCSWVLREPMCWRLP